MNVGDICNRKECKGMIRTKEGDVKRLHAQLLKQLPYDRPDGVQEALKRIHLIPGKSRPAYDAHAFDVFFGLDAAASFLIPLPTFSRSI